MLNRQDLLKKLYEGGHPSDEAMDEPILDPNEDFENESPNGEFDPEIANQQNAISPERSFYSPDLKREVKPFEDSGEELLAAKEANKHSQNIFGKPFDNLDPADKIKLYLKMDEIKKQLGIKTSPSGSYSSDTNI